MDTLRSVCQTDPHDLRTFADVLAEHFERDGQRFKDAVVTLRRLEDLDHTYVQHIEGLP